MPKSKNGDHFLLPTIPKNGGIDSCFAQIKSLKSSNGCFGLLIHKGTGCEVGRAQKTFLLSSHPNIEGQ